MAVYWAAQLEGLMVVKKVDQMVESWVVKKVQKTVQKSVAWWVVKTVAY
jgi:hypothetical protein